MVELEQYLFASRRDTLILLVQNKVSKQKDTPYRFFPALLVKAGGCGTRFAQTVLAENSRFDCDARRGSRGRKKWFATVSELAKS